MIRPANHPDYFFTDEMPSGYTSLTRYFFSQRDFLGKERSPDRSFFLVNQSENEIQGFAFFYSEKGGWKSPKKAPFGGFDLNPGQNDLNREFIHFVLQQLTGAIELRLFPSAYDPEIHDILDESLIQHGFNSVREEPNHHIPVDSEPIILKIHDMERRKLKAADSMGFEFREEPQVSVGRIYDFIHQRRIELGYEISMNREEVIQMINQAPGHYHIFSVYYQEELIAATISVVINKDIIYNFYPADHPEYRKYSPTVFLNAGLYAFCQDHGYSMLDLGTSFLDGKPNESLIAFKERMGGVLSYRKSYQRD